MVSYIYPDRFQGVPFIRKEITKNDYSILIDGLVAGRIINQPRSDGKTVWFWSVTGPYIPPELQPTNGEAETLEVAQQALKVKFLQWQRWAIAESKEAAWHA
jgi:hypothetical protein